MQSSTDYRISIQSAAVDEQRLGKLSELGESRGWLKTVAVPEGQPAPRAEPVPPSTGWVVYDPMEREWHAVPQLTCTVHTALRSLEARPPAALLVGIGEGGGAVDKALRKKTGACARAPQRQTRRTPRKSCGKPPNHPIRNHPIGKPLADP